MCCLWLCFVHMYKHIYLEHILICTSRTMHSPTNSLRDLKRSVHVPSRRSHHTAPWRCASEQDPTAAGFRVVSLPAKGSLFLSFLSQLFLTAGFFFSFPILFLKVSFHFLQRLCCFWGTDIATSTYHLPCFSRDMGWNWCNLLHTWSRMVGCGRDLLHTNQS